MVFALGRAKYLASAVPDLKCCASPAKSRGGGGGVIRHICFPTSNFFPKIIIMGYLQYYHHGHDCPLTWKARGGKKKKKKKKKKKSKIIGGKLPPPAPPPRGAAPVHTRDLYDIMTCLPPPLPCKFKKDSQHRSISTLPTLRDNTIQHQVWLYMIEKKFLFLWKK